jgi:hypothetical protein
MLNFIEWLALPGGQVSVRPAQGGRGLIYLGRRHSRRVSIGVDYLGVPCIGLSIMDRQLFSTATWERAVFAIGCDLPPLPQNGAEFVETGDFLGLIGKEARNNGRYAIWMPATPDLFAAIEEVGTRAGTISSGHGRARVGFFYVEDGAADKPQWLNGEDVCDIPIDIVRDQVCDANLAWPSPAAAVKTIAPQSGSGKKTGKKRRFGGPKR